MAAPSHPGLRARERVRVAERSLRRAPAHRARGLESLARPRRAPRAGRRLQPRGPAPDRRRRRGAGPVHHGPARRRPVRVRHGPAARALRRAARAAPAAPRPAGHRRLDVASHRPQRAAAGGRRREQPGAAVRPPGLPRLLRARGLRRLPGLARPRLLGRERARAQRHLPLAGAPARHALVLRAPARAARQPAGGRGRGPRRAAAAGAPDPAHRAHARRPLPLDRARARRLRAGRRLRLHPRAGRPAQRRAALPDRHAGAARRGRDHGRRRAAGAEGVHRGRRGRTARARLRAVPRQPAAAGSGRVRDRAVARAPARVRRRAARHRVRGRRPGLGRSGARVAALPGSISRWTAASA